MEKIEKALLLLAEMMYTDRQHTQDEETLLYDARMELAELKKNLKSIEWVDNEAGRHKEYEFCPACNATERHGSDCWLSKAIRW